MGPKAQFAHATAPTQGEIQATGGRHGCVALGLSLLGAGVYTLTVTS